MEKFKNQNEGITPEQWAEYEAYMSEHPEIDIPIENRRECGPEIIQFEDLCTRFEQTHDLRALNEIKTLTEVVVDKFSVSQSGERIQSIREPAKQDLIPIVSLMNTLKKETDISEEKHEELKARYRILSRAVGIVNSRDEVDHTR